MHFICFWLYCHLIHHFPDRHFPALHFPAPLFGLSFSSPAFSVPAFSAPPMSKQIPEFLLQFRRVIGKVRQDVLTPPSWTLWRTTYHFITSLRKMPHCRVGTGQATLEVIGSKHWNGASRTMMSCSYRPSRSLHVIIVLQIQTTLSVFASGTPISLLILLLLLLLFLLEPTLQKRPKLSRFKSNRNEIWQYFSSNK